MVIDRGQEVTKASVYLDARRAFPFRVYGLDATWENGS
jgi:hypothetical protein